MAVRYEVDVANHLVRTTYYGLVTHSDPSECSMKLQRDPAFDPTFSELVKFEDLSEIQLNASDFGSEIDPFSKAAKRAIVGGTQKVVYGTARMFQLVRREYPNIKVFITEVEAEAWILRTEN